MKRLTFEEFMSFDPCWLYKNVKEIYDQYPAGMTDLDILNRPDVSADDKLWSVLRPEFIDEPILHEFACINAEYALSLIDNPDPRSVNAIAIKRRWLRGEATDEELYAAWVAARNAAWDAAWVAARDTVRDAAWDAARDAAGAAAGAAARAAAWVAAGDAARAAAWVAARDAAWVAVWDAVWDAATAAARDAARDAQVVVLIMMLEETSKQKVIINKCFGGYGFEPFTIQKYADAKGIELFWYTRDYSHSVGPLKEKWDKTTIEAIEQQEGLRLGNYPLTKDMGSSFIFDWGGEMYNDIVFKLSSKDETRTDSLLIEIIEKYGDKNRRGCHAPTVIEVPDGVEWVVDEYDGYESLHEAHRVFG